MSSHVHSLLCLGDSYTVGEAIPLHESFPYQTVQLLRKAGHHFHAPEIIAKTGWTTAELAEHLIHHKLEDQYDFVTLLIGVNNQYRGLSEEDYKNDFSFLIRKAIHYAKGNTQKVIVISIPDWGVTPFAKKKGAKDIGASIDAFNEINSMFAMHHGCQYLQITDSTRKAAKDSSLIAVDGLHPSWKEYRIWAEELSRLISKQLK